MSTRQLITVLTMVGFVFCSVSHGMLLVFYDDFEDNDISDWSIAPFMSEATSPSFYDPVFPAVSGGKIWGKGSGYSNPLYTWMVKSAPFQADGGLALQIMGHSGTSWPNQVNVYLMTDAWPREGYIYNGGGQFDGKWVEAWHEGYQFVLYGESIQLVELYKHYYVGGTRTTDYLFQWGHNVVSDQTYRFERDASGNWYLWYGNADGSNMQLAPIGAVNDSAFSDFGDVAVRLYRSQSTLDYIQVEVIPEPAIEATIDIDPDTLNFKSKGKWITCYVELPEGYDVSNIDVGSISLEFLLEVQHSDVQDDVLMVKFDRQDVIAYIELVLEIEPPADVTLILTGELTDGTPFEGSDTIRVVDKGGKK